MKKVVLILLFVLGFQLSGPLVSYGDCDCVGDEYDEDLGAWVRLTQKTGFLVNKGRIVTKAYSTSVEGDIYTTGFTFLNSNIVFSTAEDFASYKRINKILGKDRQDITIGVCRCSGLVDLKNCLDSQCMRPDEVERPFYYNTDERLEYINPGGYYKKRYYHPIYIKNPEIYSYISPPEKKFDICLGIDDLEYKWGSNDDFTAKKFCIRKDYQFSEEKGVKWVVGNITYPINIKEEG